MLRNASLLSVHVTLFLLGLNQDVQIRQVHSFSLFGKRPRSVPHPHSHPHSHPAARVTNSNSNSWKWFSHHDDQSVLNMAASDMNVDGVGDNVGDNVGDGTMRDHPNPAQQDHNLRAPGTILTDRILYRFSSTESAVQTPYTIEERQQYIVTDDKLLEPFGDKSIIFRGAPVTVGKNEKDDTTRTGTGTAAVGQSKSGAYAKVGPELYTVTNLRHMEMEMEMDIDKNMDNNDSNNDDDSSHNYVMALYCMEHPDIFMGRGLELGR